MLEVSPRAVTRLGGPPATHFCSPVPSPEGQIPVCGPTWPPKNMERRAVGTQDLPSVKRLSLPGSSPMDTPCYLNANTGRRYARTCKQSKQNGKEAKRTEGDK